MIDSANMTHAEYYRLNGILSAPRIEALLQLEALLAELPTSTGDALAGFPDEDFLNPIIDRLRGLAQGMRTSENKNELLSCVVALQELAHDINLSAESGAHDVKQVDKALTVLRAVL